MPGSIGKLELVGLCFKGSCSKYRWGKTHARSTPIHEVVLPKEQYPKQVDKFPFLLKQRDSTAYNEKLESAYVKAHYITKKERYERIRRSRRGSTDERLASKANHITKKERYKRIRESRGGGSEERLATAPRPYSSSMLLHAHDSGSKRNPTWTWHRWRRGAGSGKLRGFL